MRNSVTLAQLGDMSAQEVANLPVDHIALLLEEVAGQKVQTKRLDDKLFAAVSLKYAGQAAYLRKSAGKDTGTVTIIDGDFAVRADLPKCVDWDETGLERVEAELLTMGEPVSDYISIKRAVPERAYSSWPSSLRKMFEPYRTVGVGKPSFKIERRIAA